MLVVIAVPARHGTLAGCSVSRGPQNRMQDVFEALDSASSMGYISYCCGTPMELTFFFWADATHIRTSETPTRREYRETREDVAGSRMGSL